MTLSTHVLDATTGRPAAGVRVRLEHGDDTGWALAGQGQTDADGRLSLAGPEGAADFAPGVYRITFGTGAYFTARGVPSFYPEVTITFEMTARDEHYHVPLLLSPYAYSTYRGS
ncbi:MAG TPA: hydroxyisourate hydrolase [Streptosporangiaceae bacterium]|nr:hydroxyisourate hydrolase [Streptosporangiaceae bacterium]